MDAIVSNATCDKALIVIEYEQELVDSLVKSWNLIVEDYENKTIMFALKVQELMRGYPEKTISAVIDKVRNHPDLKNSASKDRIMMGIRLINNRPDLIEWQTKPKEEIAEMTFDDKPYRKRDGTIFWEFYFELYKYNIVGKQKELEDLGKQEMWSVRKLVQEIQKVRQEWAEPNKRVGLQKHALIRELVIMLRELDPQDLIMLKDVIGKEYDTKLIKYKKWIEKQSEVK